MSASRILPTTFDIDPKFALPRFLSDRGSVCLLEVLLMQSITTSIKYNERGQLQIPATILPTPAGRFVALELINGCSISLCNTPIPTAHTIIWGDRL
jgi:hypothetical protein